MKASYDLRSHSGAKTYMNWFDGWSVKQYILDRDALEYFRRNKIDQSYSMSKQKDIGEAEINELKQRKPHSINGILNLETHWNEDVDEYEKANSNFWMFHLDKQVFTLTKKEYSLENFKCMDAFFTSGLLNKEDSIFQLTKKQKEILNLENEQKQLEWFGKRDKTVKEKYEAWKAIDLVYRYTLQQKAFDSAKRELRKEGKDTKHKNLMTLLIAQIERPVDEKLQEAAEKINPNFVVQQLAKKQKVDEVNDNAADKQKNKNQQSLSNPLKFNLIKSQKWRGRQYHRVYDLLLDAWRT